jgi:hypothetical protein
MNYADDVVFHRQFLRMLAKRMAPACYVELGVREGFTIQEVAPHCKLAVGVDILRPADADKYKFFEMRTEEFIKEVLPSLPPPELVLIDADHDARAVLADFNGVWRHVAFDGLVVLHDTYPGSTAHLEQRECGNAWEVAQMLAREDYECVTLPFPPGLTVVRKQPARFLTWR